MIWFYSGTNGSGKSLHVAKDIYKRLRRSDSRNGYNHNQVIATFDIATNAIKNFCGHFTQVPIYDLTPAMLTKYALQHHKLDGNPNLVEGQTMVVIDEAQRIFNPRDYDKNGRREWLDWLPEHRKYGFNIIMISPYDKMIDKQIRALFEYEVKHRKANNFGFIGLLLSLFHMPVFFAINYWYGVKTKNGVETFLASRKYTRIYNTFQRFGHDGDPLAARTADGAAAPVRGPVPGRTDSANTEEGKRLLVLELVQVLRQVEQRKCTTICAAAALDPVCCSKKM